MLDPTRPPPSLSPSPSRRVPTSLNPSPAHRYGNTLSPALSPTKSPLKHKSPSKSPGKSPGKSPMKARSGTGSSVSTMDIGSKEDYIYTAAGQVSTKTLSIYSLYRRSFYLSKVAKCYQIII